MNGISAIQGEYSSVMSTRQLEAQYQAAALSMQQNAMEDAGEQAVQLIQGSVITDPAIGQNLDVFA